MTDQRFKSFPTVSWSALYIDLKYSQWLQTMTQFLVPSDRNELVRGIEQQIIKKTSERLLITVSVRTCFDLALQTLNFEPGSEIIATSVNIPDMVTIMKYHQLKVIPVEIAKNTLAPSLDDLKAAYKPGKTKAILVSYYFGARYDATEIFKWAKENKLFIFEDEAESYTGPQRNGNDLADFTFFSFGSIKPFTACGGALNIIRNNEGIYRKMKQTLESYDYLPRKQYLKKMLKNSVLMWVLNFETGHDVGRYLISNVLSRDRDYKEYVIEKLRGFQPHPKTFLNTFRYQVPVQMMFLLALRVATFDQKEFILQNQKIKYASDKLEQNGVEVVGSANKDRTYWLFPVVVPDPELFFKVICSRGIVGTYLGATQLKLIESPLGYSHKYPLQTSKFFNNLVYLPIHRDVPQDKIDIIVKETIETLKIVKDLTNRKVAAYPKL